MVVRETVAGSRGGTESDYKGTTISTVAGIHLWVIAQNGPSPPTPFYFQFWFSEATQIYKVRLNNTPGDMVILNSCPCGLCFFVFFVFVFLFYQLLHIKGFGWTLESQQSNLSQQTHPRPLLQRLSAAIHGLPPHSWIGSDFNLLLPVGLWSCPNPR